MTTKINYIEMPVNDIDAAKTFYSKVFGWKFKDYGEDYTTFRKSGVWGGLYRSDNTMSSKSGSALIILYHRDLTSIMAKILKYGGEVIIETFDFPGGSRFHFSDVCGNELAVWSDAETADNNH